MLSKDVGEPSIISVNDLFSYDTEKFLKPF